MNSASTVSYTHLFGDSPPSNTTVKGWIAEIKMGGTSTTDEPRSGRPIEVTTTETIEKIHKIVFADHRVSDWDSRAG